MGRARFPARSAVWLPGVFLVGLLSGCGAPEPSPDDLSLELDLGTQADLSPLPDFRTYVVGEPPQRPRPTRDPFDSPRPTPDGPTADKPAPVPLTLVGIVRSDGRLVALLNKGSVSLNESIDGWTVIHLEEKAVVLAKGLATKRLTL